MQIFDSHCHLDDAKFEENYKEIVNRANQNDVSFITTIGINKETSEKAIRIAIENNNIYATIGLYPEYCNEDEVDLSFIENLIEQYGKEKIVAIGEIGLDYHREETNKENQIKHFIKQIELANKYDLPIAIHNRNADMDVLSVIKNHKINRGFLMHCFSSSLEVAKEVIKLGGYISFSGTVTFKNAKNLVEVAKFVPEDRILVETDAPYLSPEPLRGRINEPANVKYTAQKIADIREMSLEKFAEITTNNAKRFYRIDN